MLTDYTDILDHLEASGSVPAGYIHDETGWVWYSPATWLEHLEPEDRDVATASLCHTIEGVLMDHVPSISLSMLSDTAYSLTKWNDKVPFQGPSRLAVAASAYRAHFNLEVPHADS